jgi:dihydrolipoamide dehydrogenase
MQTMTTEKKLIAVIGAGPGGYVVAIKLAQQGLPVVLLDASGGLGGTCLQWGCVPTKALLEWSHQLALWREGHWPGLHAAVNVEQAWPQALAWKQQLVSTLQGGIKALLKKHKVQVHSARATFLETAEPLTLKLEAVEHSPTDLPATLRPAAVVLATGGKAVALPQLPVDGQRVWSVEQALASEALPKHLAILGGGVIGLEMATLYSQLGVAVTVIEGLPGLLPGWQPEAVAVVQNALQAKGVRFELGSRLNTASVSSEAVSLTLENGSTLQASHVLVAVGRTPNTHTLNLEAVNVKINEQGAVVVNAQCRSSNPAVFAIGDCTPGAQLAHRASYEAAIVAKVLAGEASAVCDWAAMPQVVYTQPALAQVGWPWGEVEARKAELKLGQFPWRSLGKAHVLAGTQGKSLQGHVCLAAQASANKLVHATMVGFEADNQIGALALALELGATLEDVAATIQPHPSLMEAWPEAAELALHGFSTHG